MPRCPSCGGSLVRVHRWSLEKVLYAQTFRCRSCERRARWLHRRVALRYGFLLSTTTRCIQCGSEAVERAAKRDRLDTLSGHAFSRLMRLTGAPLNDCDACRLQYYDWRPVEAGSATSDES